MVMKRSWWPKSRWWRYLAIGSVIFAALVVGTYVYSRWVSTTQQIIVGRNENAVASFDESRDLLRIACYNIAHGRGIAESNLDGGDQKQRAERLEEIAGLLRQLDADVVVLNEVDFDTSWSHGVNQARQLAQQCGYPYWVEQRNLDFGVLGWRWCFGNAVLSKFPIREAGLLKLPPHSVWESWLVGQKQAVSVKIETPGYPLDIIGIHLEHRDESDRTAAVRAILNSIAELESTPLLLGDLNSTPNGFPNSMTDGAGDNALDLLDRSQRFRREPANVLTSDQMTFHSQQPDRVIDWILIPSDWQFRRYFAVDSNLSDHRPIVAEVQVNSLK